MNKSIARLEEIEKEIKKLNSEFSQVYNPQKNEGYKNYENKSICLHNEKQGILLRLEDEEELLEEHRSKSILTCREDCFCWELETMILKTQLLKQSERFR